MSTQIDERVVSMQFDNRNFESNVSHTLSTLDKLKRSLNFTGATRGLESIDYASKKITMTALGGALDSIHSKFSALEVVGVATLANLTHSALNAAKRISAAFTTDPIKTGFSEYETQINAIQTILANTESKGSTLQDVNNALAELNTYADKTIYNFTEMTRNIGTFTAAGVELDTSVSAIKGIANLAAVSGSTSQQASTAMYQLSQALASGTVKLMDWNSVVNAGMGGQVFQDALKETARVHGIAIDSMIESEGSFRETLKDGWLTSEILTETLSKFTGDLSEKQLKSMGYTEEQIEGIIKMGKTANDAATKVKTFTQLFDTLKEAAQSGWTKTWELIVGDFGEAKDLLTKISDTLGKIIGDSAQSRNDLLLGGLATGWKQLLAKGIDDAAGFEEMVTNVAKSHGVNVKKMMGDDKTFQDTLKEGWLNGDILSESITKFTKKVNKMSAEELEAAGYTKEHVKNLNKLNKQFKDGTINADGFAKIIARQSGRENLIESLSNTFDALLSVIKPIKEAFSTIFPATTAQALYKFTGKLVDITKNLSLTGEQGDKLRRTFEGVFAVLDIGVEILKGIWNGIKSISGPAGDLANTILDNTAAIGDWLVKLRKTIKESKIFSKGLSNIVEVIMVGFGAASKYISGFIDGVRSLISQITEGVDTSGFESIHDVLEILHDRVTTLKDAFKGVGTSVKDAFASISLDPLVKALQYVIDAIKFVFNGLVQILEKADYNAIVDIINGGLLAGILTSVKKFIDGFGSSVKSAVKIGDSIKDILNGTKDCLESFQDDLKAKTLLKIAGAIAILAASLLVISLIDSKKLASSLGALTGLLVELMAAIKFVSTSVLNLNKEGVKLKPGAGGIFSTIALMVGMSTSLLILASALKKIGDLDITKMWSAFGVISALMLSMGLFMGFADKFGNIGVKSAVGMVIMAGAIKVLASVCGDLAEIKAGDLARIVAALGALMGELAVFMTIARYGKVTLKSAAGMVLIAGAIKIVASVCKDFATMKVDQLKQSLTTIAILLAEIAAFMLVARFGKIKLKSAAGIVLLAASLKIFASACADFATFKPDKLKQSLQTIAIIFAELAAFSRITKGSNLLTTSVGMVIVSGALLIMSEVLDRFGSLKPDVASKGLKTLGASLLILALALNAMKHTLLGSAALLVAVVAIGALVPLLGILGAMSINSIVKALVAMAGAFVILGVASAVLGPMVGTILSLTGAIALLGLGIALIGGGIFAVGAGLTSLAAGFTAILAALPGALVIIVQSIKTVILGVIDIIPEVIKRLGTIITTLCDVIIEGAPSIAKALGAIIKAVLEILVEYVPIIVDGILKLVVALLDALVKYTPKIVGALFQFLIKILDELAARLPELIVAAVNVLMSLFKGVVEALKAIDPKALLDGLLAVGLLSALIVALAAIGSLIPAAMITVLGLGVVVAEMALVLAAIGALSQIPGLSWLIEEGGNFLQTVGTAIGQFIGGIVGGVGKGISASMPRIAEDLSEFADKLQPFITGIKAVNQDVINGVDSLVNMILSLTAANVIERMTAWATGGSSLVTFGQEIAAFAPYIKQYAESIKGVDGETVEASANAALALAKMADIIPKTGGLAAVFAGENNMLTFGEQLPAFGKSMKKYADAVSGIDSESVTNSATAAKAIAELAANIPNSGGIVSWFTGENDLGTFAEQLIPFGKAVKKYSESVVGIDNEAISNSSKAVKKIVTIAESIPNTGGLIAWLTGDNNVETFGTSLSSFGKGIAKYSSAVSSVNIEAVNNASKAIKEIVKLFKSMSDLNLTGVGVFKKSLETLGSSSFDKFTKAFGDSDKLKGLGSDMVEGIAKGVQNSRSSLNKKMTSVLNSTIEKIESTEHKFRKVGQTVIDKFVKGMEFNAKKTVRAWTTIFSSMTETMRAKYEVFYGIGKFLVSGFASGISAHTWYAEAKSRAMAAAAAEAAKDELDEHSPSKVGYEIGDFFGVAFVNAIGDYANKAYKAGTNMAGAAREGLSEAIAKASDYINGNVDAQPTIRPVLDLSNVSSGVGAISRMLDFNPSVGVMTNVRAINSMMRNNRHNDNSDIVSAIKDLQNGSSGDTYYIDGVTYDDGSNISTAVKTIVRAAKVGRRV